MNTEDLAVLHQRLIEIHGALAAHFAHEPHWWPILTDDPPFEVIVGMVLVQQTRWQTVEAAIRRLIAGGWMSPAGIVSADPAELALLIRPCAFHTQKALGLQAIMRHLLERYAGDTATLLAQESAPLRAELLALPRIGRETADTIMLYGAGHASFIVDAYARRILSRAGLPTSIDIGRAPYDTVKDLVEQGLAAGPLPELSAERQSLPAFITPRSALTSFHWDFHALLVEASIHHCTASRQRCGTPGLRPAFVDDRKCAAHCRSCSACPLSATCATYGVMV